MCLLKILVSDVCFSELCMCMSWLFDMMVVGSVIFSNVLCMLLIGVSDCVSVILMLCLMVLMKLVGILMLKWDLMLVRKCDVCWLNVDFVVVLKLRLGNVVDSVLSSMWLVMILLLMSMLL